MQYKIIRSDRKTMALQIKDGQLIVRAPRRTSVAVIENFVRDNYAWVEKQLRAAASAPKLPPLSNKQLKELTAKAAAIFPERVKYYADLLGVSYGRITVRHQRTRWGSCSSSGSLNLNCLLVLTPPQVLDSVIAHELCHRKHMNHSPAFYAELTRVFPQYQQCRNWLKQNGGALMSRLPKKETENN